jgi:hypothetical protein
MSDIKKYKPELYAFPCGIAQNGMTLRDWFAGQALASSAGYLGQSGILSKDIACAVYSLADALLAERSTHEN